MFAKHALASVSAYAAHAPQDREEGVIELEVDPNTASSGSQKSH